MVPEHTPELTRPNVRPRTTSLPVLTAIVAATTAVGFGVGVAAMTFLPRAPAPVSLRAIGVPYPVMPAEPVVEDVAVDEPAEGPGPRAGAPTLDAACVLPVTDGATAPTACSWDDGFPAISSDGATVVAKINHDDGGRGYPNLDLVFFDTHTAKLVRTITVLSANEYSDAPADQPKFGALIATRVASAQKVLDAGHYRPMTFLASSRTDSTDVADPTARAEVDGDAVRLFDIADDDLKSEKVIWQHHFTVDHTPSTSESECSGFAIRDQTIHWDRATRTVFANQRYSTGGSCMCSDDDYQVVARIP
jgi:hypothetical protein